MITELAAAFPVQELCRMLHVSRSGYYRWRRRRPTRRQTANERLLAHIKSAFEKSRGTYGSPRLTRQLQRQQIACGKNRVARLMRQHGLKARSKRPFRPRTTDSRGTAVIAPNRLKSVQPLRPDQVWVADITYLGTARGWLYLAAVMDLFSRKIVGWSLGWSLHATLPLAALDQALASRNPTQSLLHHSDRGCQYGSADFRARLAARRLTPSMSRPGNCYDNAAMESFWSTLKTELPHLHAYQNLPDLRLALFDYIEVFYNRQRLHSSLNYQSPVDFESQPSHK
jgi:transposase InsO family protein